MDAYKLKMIAVIGMVLNHIVIGWQEIIPFWLMFPLTAAGGLTFPIMAYFAVEGYKYTSNLGKYIGRLAIVGLISAPFHALTFGVIQPNIMFSIIWGLLALKMYDKLNKVLFFVLLIPMLIIAFILPMDLYILNILLMLLFYTIKREGLRRTLPPILAGVIMLFLTGSAAFNIWHLSNLAPYSEEAYSVLQVFQASLGRMGNFNIMMSGTTYIIGAVVASILLFRFNGQRGKQAKWLFYVSYPLHFVIIGLVALAMGWATFPFIQ